MAAPMSTEELENLAIAAVALYNKQKNTKKRKKRKVWTKDWLLNRNKHSELLEELRLQTEDWFNYLRMDQETYFKLLSIVTPFIKKLCYSDYIIINGFLFLFYCSSKGVLEIAFGIGLS